MIKQLANLAINLVGLAAAAAVAVTAGSHFEHASVAPPPPRHHVTPPPPLSYLGVYEPTSPHSYTGVETFTRRVGSHPNIAVYYSSWWEPFQIRFARAAQAHGATPMVQLEPRNVSLAAIAAGHYDSYVRAYARAIRSFGHPVILCFGHEMNANWYGWGYQHTPPREFIAAWRHLHHVFAVAGAHKVRWLWTVNVVGGPQVSAAVGRWWPGAHYVTWIGVDGHYFQPGIGFAQLFGATLDQVRKLGSQPVLVAEAGIAPYVGISKIADLFAGARAHGAIGVVWFDVAGHNLRIVNDPAAVVAFRAAASRYLTGPGNGGPTPGPTPPGAPR